MAVETWRGRKYQMPCSYCGGDPKYVVYRNPNTRWECPRCSGAMIEIAPDSQIRKFLMEERKRRESKRTAAELDAHGRLMLEEIGQDLEGFASQTHEWKKRVATSIAWNLFALEKLYGADFFARIYPRAIAKLPEKYHGRLNFELSEIRRIDAEPIRKKST